MGHTFQPPRRAKVSGAGTKPSDRLSDGIGGSPVVLGCTHTAGRPRPPPDQSRRDGVAENGGVATFPTPRQAAGPAPQRSLFHNTTQEQGARFRHSALRPVLIHVGLADFPGSAFIGKA